MAAVSAGVNRPRSKIKRTIGVASTSSPSVAGTFSISIMRSPLDTACRMPADRRGVPRGPKSPASEAVAIEIAEQPDRHVHQPERVVEPRHRAGAQTRPPASC